MKVLMINGSPNKNGCTFTALSEVAATLAVEGIESQIIQIEKQAVPGCIACGSCKNTGVCVLPHPLVNEALRIMEQCDGLIVGSPVYYASANGTLISFLDRLFYAGNCFAHKPAAAIASARRAGTTATIDEIQKYFTISQMPIVSSQYWPMVHGNTPDEVRQDLEGLQTMRVLGRNMAWLLRCIDAGRQTGVAMPKAEQRVWTNFI